MLDSLCGRNRGEALCSRWLAERLLLDASGYLEGILLGADDDGLRG